MSERARADFAEQMGLFFEGWGGPRMAGRILGWLYVCDPAEQSAAELGEALQASAGSVSTGTRLLIDFGLVEKHTRPGDRRTFYRVREGGTVELLNRDFQALLAFKALMGRGLAAVGRKASRRRRLEEALDLLGFFEAEYPKLIERWERERARRAKERAS